MALRKSLSQLFGPKPDWLHEDPARRLKSIATITDFELLVAIAGNDAAPPVRAAAARRMCDDNAILNLLKEESSPLVQRALVRSMIGPAALSEAAMMRTLEIDTRVEIISKLSHQPTLERLAKGDCSKAIRAACVAKLTNREVLKQICDDDRSGEVVCEATSRLVSIGGR